MEFIQENELLVVIGILAFNLSFAIFFGNLANKKGYPGFVWGAIGFFFPVLYLIILLMPERKQTELSEKEKQIRERKYRSSRDIAISFLVLALLIGFALFMNNYTSEQDELNEEYKNYVYDYLVEGYLAVKTDNFQNNFEDQKIYVQDLYDMYMDDEFYSYPEFVYDEDDVFTSYYEENEDELKDDYIIVINETKPEDGRLDWTSYYYEVPDIEEEIADYSLDYVIVKYEEEKTNNYQNDVVAEKVKIKTLYEKKYFSNYFKTLYEKNEKKFKNHYIVIKPRGGKIYDKEYHKS